jgi:transketolase C-terminal domain/subunit
MQSRRPAYVRIGKSSCDIKPLEDGLNHMAVRNSSSDILVITHGTMIENCVKAVNLCDTFSICCMNKIKPLDKEQLRGLFERFSRIVVIEDHMVTSGLYNSVCQCLVEMRFPGITLYSIGTPEIYEDVVGDKGFFADRYGYSPEKIALFISGLK